MSESKFTLHPTLAADCHHVMDAKLCRILLMDESRYPWLILVPMRPNLKDLHELTVEDTQQFWQESRLLSECLSALPEVEKLNVAAIGNMVPQLHIHHIGRHQQDAAWPAPVWGKFQPLAYSQDALIRMVSFVKSRMI